MKLLILLTLISSISAAVIDKISSTSPDWPSQSELVKILEQENLPYDIDSNPVNLNAVVPYCLPTTVTKRRGVTYTKTVQLPVTVTQKIYEASPPTVTVTEKTTVTQNHIVTKYQPAPDLPGRQQIHANKKVKTEDGDDTCIYVGDVTGGYDVLTIVADLVAQVLHTIQYYIDQLKGTDIGKAGVAEAFIAAVKLTLHIKGVGCGLLDDNDPIIGFPGSADGDLKSAQDVLNQILDFNPLNKNNPLAQLRDTVLDVIKQMGIDNFEALRPLLENDELVKQALFKAGLLTGPLPIESKGEKELRQVLHLVGLPGLANFKGLFLRFFKAAGENNFSDNIEQIIKDSKNTPYKGSIGRMDTTHFMDYVETKNLQPSYNATILEKTAVNLDPQSEKKLYDELLHAIASSLMNMKKPLDHLVPPLVDLYFKQDNFK